ncbi:MAG: type II toxin-antitoxin system RelE/ParE family toxin [Sideroxydans sp.]|nr:type II toxin-antitoxin system RelE/ParE family toxin [Sideroxydans sp.]
MNIRELSPALDELDEALGHYANISPMFAQALMDEIKAAKRLIVEYPLAWKPMSGGLRGFPLRRYPYLVIYHIFENEVLIVAYAHFKRRPGYWKNRTS